jgi:MFS family permease
MDAMSGEARIPTDGEATRAAGRNGESTMVRQILRALRHRNYRLFFAGQLVSLVGTFLSQVATLWLVFRLTRNPWWLGVAGFAGQIPMFLLTPFGGVWVDRWNRQRLLVITQALAMLQSFSLAVLAFTHINLWEIIALSVFQGVINAFDLPARQAFMIEMIADREDLANAIALNSTMVHGARLIGPAMAGLLIAWVGEAWCFLIDGFSYLGVIAALMAMRIAPRALPTERRSVLSELAEGIRYVWNFVPIRALIIMVAVVSLTGMPAFSVLTPIFADYLGGERGAQTLGLLMASSGLGALAGALYLASRKSVVGLGKTIALAAGTFGVGLIAFGMSRTLWVSLAVIPVIGFGMITTFASTNTVLQTLADDDKRGRVMSIFTTAFIGVIPFGNLLAGALARRLGAGKGGLAIDGAAHTVMIAGSFCVVVAAAFWSIRPKLRKIVWPIYVKKGILSEVAAGMNAAAELTGPSGTQV